MAVEVIVAAVGLLLLGGMYNVTQALKDVAAALRQQAQQDAERFVLSKQITDAREAHENAVNDANLRVLEQGVEQQRAAVARQAQHMAEQEAYLRPPEGPHGPMRGAVPAAPGERRAAGADALTKEGMMQEHLALLGFKVRDLVTGFEGICESIGFDLYGCVQAVVRADKLDDKGLPQDGRWFDLKRLVQVGTKPVMEAPTFDVVPGPVAKPKRPDGPLGA